MSAAAGSLASGFEMLCSTEMRKKRGVPEPEPGTHSAFMEEFKMALEESCAKQQHESSRVKVRSRHRLSEDLVPGHLTGKS